MLRDAGFVDVVAEDRTEQVLGLWEKQNQTEPIEFVQFGWFSISWMKNRNTIQRTKWDFLFY